MILHTARREQVDLGPSKGRIAGVRGSALGGSFVVTAVKLAQPRRIAIPRQPLAQARKLRCERLTRYGDRCARLPGHAHAACASRAALDHENERRRGR